MELLLEIVGWSIIGATLSVVLYTFVKLLSIALNALTNNDD